LESVHTEDHCGHRLCELIGDGCSLATGRSRGCRPLLAPKTIADDVIDEVRALVPIVVHDRAAAIRLAEIIRREAREDRSVLAAVRDEDLEIASTLAALCVRHSREP
jgi:hypothetical protein